MVKKGAFAKIAIAISQGKTDIERAGLTSVALAAELTAKLGETVSYATVAKAADVAGVTLAKAAGRSSKLEAANKRIAELEEMLAQAEDRLADAESYTVTPQGLPTRTNRVTPKAYSAGGVPATVQNPH